MKKTNSPLILSIDTSCDDTSAAVTQGPVVLSNVVASQAQLHKQYGGVFPTVAKQAHKENIDPTVRAALRRAHITMQDLAAIAVTQGPGLAPALEIGIEKAKSLALECGLPLIPVNHIEGHVLSALARRPSMPAQNLQFPLLGIVVSGKHTEFISIKEIGVYERLGFTVDDAAGEALDKFGRMVDLGYPAGAAIEEFAQRGDAKKYSFPLPMTTSGNANLSFSGLKTSARTLTEQLARDHNLTKHEIYDLCASFQYAVFRSITYKLNKILQQQQFFGVLLGGGVAANVTLRRALRTTLQPYHLPLLVPYSKRLCADNAAMIGVVAGFTYERESGKYQNKKNDDSKTSVKSGLRNEVKSEDGKILTTTIEIQNLERVPRWHVGENIA